MQSGYSVVVALAASLLLTGAADAAAKDKKSQVQQHARQHVKHHVTRHWHGYGFLPGYRPPQRIAWERRLQRGPIYYWDARAGFYRERWNGGGFGPCWERTPIGPMWTCGR